MSDDKTIATVANPPEQTSPATAAGLSVGKDFLIIAAGISTIWTVFSTAGLTGVYNWLNSIPAMPFLSLAGLGALIAWGSAKRWLSRRFSQQQRAVINIIANAPPAEAAATVQALREAAPEAPPIALPTQGATP